MHRRVEVAVRVRPGNRSGSSDVDDCVSLDTTHGVISVVDVSGQHSTTGTRRYAEDLLLGESITNHDVFEQLVRSRLSDATAEHPDTLCFLAYGHTSSGKTHTIAGSEQEPGLLTLCVEELLRRESVVEVSMVEVYMDNVHDLLAEGEPRRIRRRASPSGTVIVVEDLTTCTMRSADQWPAVAAYGMRSRRTAPTERNPRSSRSHAIFTLKSRGVRLCLVDLAGSERQTVFSPQLNKESIGINKSLSRLSTVLEALSVQRIREDGSRSYVNFRDTMLTVLLQRYLSGSSQTTFLACIHPSALYFQETLSTLRYTQRLKRIKTSLPPPPGAEDVSVLHESDTNQQLLNEVMQLRQAVRSNHDVSRQVELQQQQRIAELEALLAVQQQELRSSAPSSAARAASSQSTGDPYRFLYSPTHHGDSVDRADANAVTRAARQSRVKDTKRVAGWLLSRVLGDLPQLNVGYDDYFDRFFPEGVQVIGYVSAMACLPPRPEESADSSPLVFLDVGDFAMGLSMVDAGIPPLVRLHKVSCRHFEAWEGQELNTRGDVLYVLAFFEGSGDNVEPIAEDGGRLDCCGGCFATEPLLPIATVLCVPRTTPDRVKETVLQRLITLQGEQDEVLEHRAGFTSFVAPVQPDEGVSLEGLLDHSLLPEAARELAGSGAGAASDESTSASSDLAKEVQRQAEDTSRIVTPYRDDVDDDHSSDGVIDEQDVKLELKDVEEGHEAKVAGPKPLPHPPLSTLSPAVVETATTKAAAPSTSASTRLTADNDLPCHLERLTKEEEEDEEVEQLVAEHCGDHGGGVEIIDESITVDPSSKHFASSLVGVRRQLAQQQQQQQRARSGMQQQGESVPTAQHDYHLGRPATDEDTATGSAADLRQDGGTGPTGAKRLRRDRHGKPVKFSHCGGCQLM